MGKVVLLICGGIHPPGDTAQLLTTLAADTGLSQVDVFAFCPASPLDLLSAQAIRQALDQFLASQTPPEAPSPDLIIWAFSAGCVGAAALASYWQRYRSRVLALFLVDGWGIPWHGTAPLHRLSHDAFTHTTSRWLGAGAVDFVAQPPVPHRRLWQSPQLVMGQQQGDRSELQLPPDLPDYLSAAEFLCGWSRHYMTMGEAGPPVRLSSAPTSKDP